MQRWGELYDLIQRNITNRGGTVLEIEKRMLTSIDRLCRASNIKIEDVSAKHRDWSGNYRQRLEALGMGDGYVGVQRIASHAVHGTWVDLYLHHLEVKGDRFAPDPTWSVVDARVLCPVAILTLDGARDYLKHFFDELPELTPLYTRIDDLMDRLMKLDQAHEEWFGKRRRPSVVSLK